MPAEVEPGFNQTFLFKLDDLPTSRDDWDRMVARSGDVSMCLTLNDTLTGLGENAQLGRQVRKNKAYRELVAVAAVEWRQVLMRQEQVFSVELQVG